MSDVVFNCEEYSSINCPKGITRFITVEDSDPRISIVGCWGVYCDNGDYKIASYDPDFDKLYIKNDSLDLSDFFQYDDKISSRGQEKVVQLLTKTSERYPFTTLFLAGDNVYEYHEITPGLKEEINKKINEWNNLPEQEKTQEKMESHFISKKRIKKDVSVRNVRDVYKNVWIEEQLSRGFAECLRGVNTQSIFLGLGNHDIESCSVLNQQLNWRGGPSDQKIVRDEGKYIPGTYYNVVYSIPSQKQPLLNVIMIDTNMFEEEPLQCSGKQFSDRDIGQHLDWFESILNNIDSQYTIIIGHIPYKAIGHKDLKFIHNRGLDPIFQIIKRFNENGSRKVQAYFCADEHDQQILYDNDLGIYLCVVGSGGTSLDVTEGLSNEIMREYGIECLYSNSAWGFSIIDFEKGDMRIHLLDVNKKDKVITISINEENGTLLPSGRCGISHEEYLKKLEKKKEKKKDKK